MTETQPEPRRHPGAVLASIGALLAGFLLAALLFADPFGWHTLDDRLGGEHSMTGGTATSEDLPEGTLYTCGMHPQVIQEGPGFCPICSMALVPIEGSANAQGHEGHDHGPVAGERDHQGAVVTIDPSVVQTMNVTTAPVERRDLTRNIRTVGYLDFDQQKMVTVTTKYSGWVEKVYVNYIGEPVSKGQKLFEVYSPELVQTQQELISALDFAGRMAGAPGAAPGRADKLVEAARRRLGYWDIDAGQIAEIERTGEPLRTLPVVSPSSGVVMKRVPGLQGMAVAPGQELYHIADLSSLWVSVEVFENQLPWLREGSSAEIRLDYFPGETFRGRVRFIEPEVSAETRTVSLRLEVPNRNGRLRAGMYATVTFEPSSARSALVVPAQSVLRTGQRDVVVVALGEGRFVPREVELGASADGWYQVLDGLSEGERVVTSAQFLIDSESHLREAIQKMVAGR